MNYKQRQILKEYFKFSPCDIDIIELLLNAEEGFDVKKLIRYIKKDRTTIQKRLNYLMKEKYIIRKQVNLDRGYKFIYKLISKEDFFKKLYSKNEEKLTKEAKLIQDLEDKTKNY